MDFFSFFCQYGQIDTQYDRGSKRNLSKEKIPTVLQPMNTMSQWLFLLSLLCPSVPVSSHFPLSPGPSTLCSFIHQTPSGFLTSPTHLTPSSARSPVPHSPITPTIFVPAHLHLLQSTLAALPRTFASHQLYMFLLSCFQFLYRGVLPVPDH